MTEKFLIPPTTNTLKPLQQGDVSQLCGLYSVLNAIRLASEPVRPIPRHISQTIYRLGIDHLERKNRLHDACKSGMKPKHQLALARDLIPRANNLLGTQMSFERLKVTPETFHRIIKSEIDHGRPVCLCIRGRIYHFTVICGYSETRYRLFDSQGRHYLTRRLCGVGNKAAETHYNIAKKSVFGLRIDANPKDAFFTS